jgi:hypothetical protein
MIISGKKLSFLSHKFSFVMSSLASFINNQVIKISNPIIQEEDSEQRKAQQVSKYFYDNNPTTGGLAGCDIAYIANINCIFFFKKIHSIFTW